MSTTTDRTGAAEAPRRAPGPVVRVHVPKHSLASELRAIRIVWRRDLIRFVNDRVRIVSSLIQPLLFLFVMGSGLQQLSRASSGVNLKTFIYPGILCIAVMFTAMFSAASIVWDREFGFLREMIVAPIRRSSIVIGKCFGGATVASTQGVIMILLGRRSWRPLLAAAVFGTFGLQLILAFSITAFGVLVAAGSSRSRRSSGVMQLIVMPMFFLSGALFPVQDLPRWLAVLNRLDPLTYAVDPMRRLSSAISRSRRPRRARSTRTSRGSAEGARAARGGRRARARTRDARDRDLGVQYIGVRATHSVIPPRPRMRGAIPMSRRRARRRFEGSCRRSNPAASEFLAHKRVAVTGVSREHQGTTAATSSTGDCVSAATTCSRSTRTPSRSRATGAYHESYKRSQTGSRR